MVYLQDLPVRYRLGAWLGNKIAALASVAEFTPVTTIAAVLLLVAGVFSAGTLVGAARESAMMKHAIPITIDIDK